MNRTELYSMICDRNFSKFKIRNKQAGANNSIIKIIIVLIYLCYTFHYDSSLTASTFHYGFP